MPPAKGTAMPRASKLRDGDKPNVYDWKTRHGQEHVGKKRFKAKTPKQKGKVEKVMHEWGQGELHSGSKKGPKVTNQKQAIAIALSEARRGKK